MQRIDLFGAAAAFETVRMPDGTEAAIPTEHAAVIYVNEQPAFRVVCTPQLLPQLALGRLLTEGWIASAEEVEQIAVCAEGLKVNIYLNHPLTARRAAGRQRVVQVDIDFQAFCADGNLFHFLCGGDPSFGQQPPQRQLRQKLGCAYHPESRLFIYIDNCGVFCWNGRFRAVRHPDGFKGGCCAEEVDSLHGGPFSVKAAVQVLLSAGRKFPKGLRVKEKRQPF